MRMLSQTTSAWQESVGAVLHMDEDTWERTQGLPTIWPGWRLPGEQENKFCTKVQFTKSCFLGFFSPLCLFAYTGFEETSVWEERTWLGPQGRRAPPRFNTKRINLPRGCNERINCPQTADANRCIICHVSNMHRLNTLSQREAELWALVSVTTPAVSHPALQFKWPWRENVDWQTESSSRVRLVGTPEILLQLSVPCNWLCVDLASISVGFFPPSVYILYIYTVYHTDWNMDCLTNWGNHHPMPL